MSTTVFINTEMSTVLLGYVYVRGGMMMMMMMMMTIITIISDMPCLRRGAGDGRFGHLSGFIEMLTMVFASSR